MLVLFPVVVIRLKDTVCHRHVSGRMYICICLYFLYILKYAHACVSVFSAPTGLIWKDFFVKYLHML